MLSQPPLSVQIRDLEKSLGAVLFQRGARQVRMTGFGEEFALLLRDILRSFDELGNLARASREGMMGRLRIDVIRTIAPDMLPTMARGLTRMHPGLDLRCARR